jgi:hypothetical protein
MFNKPASVAYTIFQGSLTEREGSVRLTSLYLTSLDQLVFILKILFTSFTKQGTLMRRSTVLSLPTQLAFLPILSVCQSLCLFPIDIS